MLKFKSGFFIIPLIIALLIVGGGFVGVYTIATGHFPKFDFKSPAPSPSPSPAKNPFPQASPAPVDNNLPERQMTPQDKGGPIKQTANISGKWVGRYTISAPAACNGGSGAWTANLVDTNGTLSGSFESDAGGGSISGLYSGSQMNFSVGGGGSGISFSGSVSGNTASGAFKGQVCDPKEAPQGTSGSFFGGRLI